MVITGALPLVRGILLLPAQFLGGIVAAALVRCMFPGPLVVNTTLAEGVTPAQGVFIEMFLTSLLVFAILMLAAEKHLATFLAPVGIGIALFVAMIAGKSLPMTSCKICADVLRRRALYRCLIEPSSQLWPGHRDTLLPRIPLHLLVRPDHGQSAGQRVLQVRKGLQLRGGKPGARRHQ